MKYLLQNANKELLDKKRCPLLPTLFANNMGNNGDGNLNMEIRRCDAPLAIIFCCLEDISTPDIIT